MDAPKNLKRRQLMQAMACAPVVAVSMPVVAAPIVGEYGASWSEVWAQIRADTEALAIPAADPKSTLTIELRADVLPLYADLDEWLAAIGESDERMQASYEFFGDDRGASEVVIAATDDPLTIAVRLSDRARAFIADIAAGKFDSRA